ncbi:serine/arginine-rich splicing factor SC35 isoform X2 [Cryptomeria japonica]|uniref:serine/arginine-rich splicing factor SC35 isoform X2 n=1 Tax=Cryptomeria japonica TaxID=3369 RepID=UPI0027DA6339|nr:serine/arginine-rich splicing factor SC35 isoform X2 [Cryptomeria japonica]
MPIISGFRYLFGHSNITICRRECLALPHIRGLCSKLLTKLFVSARVMMNPQTGWSKGFAFVEFASETEADDAVNRMDGQVLDGKRITVNYARPSFRDTCVDPPRAVGPPSQILEENKEQTKVGKKGLQKAVSSQSQASKKNEPKKTSKEKEKNDKGGKKKKGPSSLNRQTFIEDFND